jgi:hypothetical protein
MWKTLREEDVQLSAGRAIWPDSPLFTKRVIFLWVGYFLHESASLHRLWKFDLGPTLTDIGSVKSTPLRCRVLPRGSVSEDTKRSNQVVEGIQSLWESHHGPIPLVGVKKIERENQSHSVL